MGRAVIGAVGVIFESEGGTLSADAAVQQSPEADVYKRQIQKRKSGTHLLNMIPEFCGYFCRVAHTIEGRSYLSLIHI